MLPTDRALKGWRQQGNQLLQARKKHDREAEA